MKYLFIILGGVVLLISILFLSSNVCIACNLSDLDDEHEQKLIIETISSDKFNEFIEAREDAVLIDIRTPEEFASGHIEGAINIDFYSPSFRDELASLDKTTPYLIYCRSGSRTGETLNVMMSMTFREVYDLKGGINSWMRNDYDVVFS